LNIGHHFYGRSWQEVAALLKKAAVCVCSDSSILHVSLGVQTKTVTIFGPTRPECVSISPLLYPIRVLGLECLGCHHIPPFPKTYSSCLKPTLLCQQVRSCTVFRKIMEVLQLNKDCSDG
jgi:ADP-heptose:LPS heptosyltransferase